MELHVAARAPNPRRVTMFMAEKGITGIDLVNVDLNAGEHRGEAFRAMSPFSKVPALRLDDGRVLSESRAICSYLEGLHPEPNLMGVDSTERAFIEMADRQIELYFFASVAQCIRHTHPGLAVLEGRQFGDYGQAQGLRVLDVARWYDSHLKTREFVAQQRFTICDITLLCALDFAKGLMKFRAADHGLQHLHAYRDRIAARPSATA